MIEAYPLHWPVGFERTPEPSRNTNFKNPSLGRARDQVLLQLKKMKATNIIISTNIPVKQDGTWYVDYARRDIPDKGVAVYFDLDGEQKVLCCDKWDRWEENFWALKKGIEAIMGLDRWGVAEMQKRAFRGFKALAERSEFKRSWWEVLGCWQDAAIERIQERYKIQAKLLHPDASTGSTVAFQELQVAYQEALIARRR